MEPMGFHQVSCKPLKSIANRKLPDYTRQTPELIMSLSTLHIGWGGY